MVIIKLATGGSYNSKANILPAWFRCTLTTPVHTDAIWICTTRTPSTLIFTFSQFCVINSPGIHHTAYPSLFRARLWFCASKSLLSPTLRSFWNSDDNSSLIIGLLNTHLSVFIQVLYLTNWFTWPGCCFVKKTVPWLCKLTIKITT